MWKRWIVGVPALGGIVTGGIMMFSGPIPLEVVTLYVIGSCLVGAGGLLNFIAIVANDWKMPVITRYEGLTFKKGYIINPPKVKLKFLVDRYPGLYGVKSIGDIIIGIGMACGGISFLLFFLTVVSPGSIMIKVGGILGAGVCLGLGVFLAFL